MRTGWLAMGQQVSAFEEAVARYTGAQYAVAVASGTAALHLALLAHGVGPGDEVIVPSLSYIASANTVRYVGARPVLVDVDRATFNLDPASAAAAITPSTRAIMPVHQLGLAAEMGALGSLARQHSLVVIEDGACALGARRASRLVGDGGATCCFSFHPRKVITTGEGGMITTNDSRLAESLRVLRSQGMSIPAAQRHEAGELLFEEYQRLGYNYRLTDIQAAIGVEQMKRLPEILRRRRLLAHRYTEAFAEMPRVCPPVEPAGYRHAFQSYMVLLDEQVSRDAVMAGLLEQGIASRRAVMAIHQTPLYHEQWRDVRLPAAEETARRGLMLPLYPQLEEEQQDRVVRAVRECLAETP